MLQMKACRVAASYDPHALDHALSHDIAVVLFRFSHSHLGTSYSNGTPLHTYVNPKGSNLEDECSSQRGAMFFRTGVNKSKV